MCGRYRLSSHPSALYAQFGLALENPDERALPPRYNIAPTQPVLAVRTRPDDRREPVLLHWGLIPHWAKEPGIGARMINARAETAAEKVSFRTALRRQRCLIPVDGFYEWQARPGGPKQPFDIARQDGAPFAFAGLWEHWQGPNGEEIESCAILTTEANAFMARLHHRMPVIIEPADYHAWLLPREARPAELAPLLQPRDWKGMRVRAVTTYVNNARNQGPECIAPVDDREPRSED